MGKRLAVILLVANLGIFSPRADATCQASIIGNLAISDKATGTTVSDPAAVVPGHAVDGILDGSVAPPAGGYLLNGEGTAERIADLLIYDDTGAAGAGFCFNQGNTITVRFTGVLGRPSAGSVSSSAYMDVYDSNGSAGLMIGNAYISQIFAAGMAESQITIPIAHPGTAALAAGPTTILYGNAAGATGAALRIKNLRIDATTVPGDSPTPVNVYLSAGATSVHVILGAPGGPSQNAVGSKLVSVGNTEQPAIPVAGGIGSGTQSSGKGLLGGSQAFSFIPGFANAFRLAGGSCQGTALDCVSQVSAETASVATSLVFSVTNIPYGVTVTFPPRIDTTVANGSAGGMVWAARNSTLTNNGSPGTLSVIYDTVLVGASPGVQRIETADHADSGTAVDSGANPNCAAPNNGSACNPNPKIGVMIASSSGSGTARLTVALGPALQAQFSGDDVAPGAVPRYSGGSSPTGGTWPAGGASNTVFTRYIVATRDYFTVSATRTTLLFPFVSTVAGFNTGMSIANTCQDTLGSSGNSVYGTFANSACNESGGITFFFFGFDGATNNPVQASLYTDRTRGGFDVAAACRGLDASGRVVPGRMAACTVSGLLPLLPGAPRSFEGYVIAVAEFNNGHGFAVQFNSQGTPFAGSSALILPGSARPIGGESLGQ